MTTYEVVDWNDVPESVRSHFRRKALAAKSKKIDPKKTTCMLYLQADHLFHNQMGTEEATIDVMTRHVQRVNSIYKDVGECGRNLDGEAILGVFFFIKNSLYAASVTTIRDGQKQPSSSNRELFLQILAKWQHFSSSSSLLGLLRIPLCSS